MNILAIAPHPDDETLGCGGTLLKHKEHGDKIYWVIVTCIGDSFKISEERKIKREKEIEVVSNLYNFEKVYKLNFPTTELDTVPMKNIVEKISECIIDSQCEILYIPNYSDVHSDHKLVSEASISCTKWFRYPTIKKVLAYETLSETEFGINGSLNNFNPNIFINIEEYIEKKIEIMNIFESEVAYMPFPRSSEVINALSIYRGATSGYKNAEAFMLLRERLD